MFSFPNTFCHKKHNSFLISSFIENTAVVTPTPPPIFLLVEMWRGIPNTSQEIPDQPTCIQVKQNIVPVDF